MGYKNYSSARRYIAYISSLGTTQLHLRSPSVIAFWSAMFPGFGHLLLSKYIRGYLLFIWEVFVNIQAHINVAIFYSFTGQFELAKKTLDIRWMLMYVPTFLLAIWDSYRTTVDLNNQYILASREDAGIKPFKMDAIGINYLDKKSPWSSAVWSCIMPGAGQFTIHRIVIAFFILVWWTAIVYYSRLLPAIHYTLLGSLEQAKSVLNVQWTLNIPSVYMFTIYDSLVNTVESNKLFDWEQSKFLKRNYQNSSFQMPSNNTPGSENMYIIATFEHSISVEKAITAIQMKGIPKDKILAAALDKRCEKPGIFDTIHKSDGLSLLDLPFILGAVLMLFGAIYGFILAWGPIIWSLIGLAAGFGIGLAVKIITNGKYEEKRTSKQASEVVLIIECKEHQVETVKDTLWSHNAFGVRKLELDNRQESQ